MRKQFLTILIAIIALFSASMSYAQASGVLNANTATAEEMAALPHNG